MIFVLFFNLVLLKSFRAFIAKNFKNKTNNYYAIFNKPWQTKPFPLKVCQ